VDKDKPDKPDRQGDPVMARVTRRTDKTDNRTPEPDRQISSLGDCLDCPVSVFERWMGVASVVTCVDELKAFNRRWGYGRGYSLAGDELAGKLRRQLDLLTQTAREAKSGYLVEQRAEAMVRGIRIANQRIEEAGNKPIDTREWQTVHPSGMVVKLVQDRAAIPMDSDYAYFSLEDIVQWIPKEVIEIIRQFPGASTTKVVTRFNKVKEQMKDELEKEKTGNFFEDMEDDIPF